MQEKINDLNELAVIASIEGAELDLSLDLSGANEGVERYRLNAPRCEGKKFDLSEEAVRGLEESCNGRINNSQGFSLGH